MEKHRGIIRKSPNPETPDQGGVSHPERQVVTLPFPDQALAPGVSMDQLQRGQKVEYQLHGEEIRNLRPIGQIAAAKPSPKRISPPPSGNDACQGRRGYKASKWHGPAPYTFVPVVTDPGAAGSLADVVLHDGLGGAGRLSGELRLELTALTPLLVGQYRYRWTELKDERGQRALEGACSPDKAILEPAMLQGQGEELTLVAHRTTLDTGGWTQRRVLIPGSSIKGAVRQGVAAMLNAPMERVAERYHSYRPNLDATANREKIYGTFAAVVDRIHADDSLDVYWVTDIKDGHWMNPTNLVRFMESPRARYKGGESVDDAFADEIEQTLKPGEVLTPDKLRHFFKDDHDRYLFRRDTDPPVSIQRYTKIYSYATGIDGGCELAQVKEDDSEERKFKHLFRALVSDTDLSVKPLRIKSPIVKQHQRTIVELADQRRGHLSRLTGSPDAEDLRRFEKLIKANTPHVNQLIYIEAELDSYGDPGQVVSFGTHFRYRWRYADSIRQVAVDPSATEREPRAQLQALTGERIVPDNQGTASGSLSGARLLFGFAAAADAGNEQIGEKDFSRLAGRIAINHAVERIDPVRSKPEDRFLYFDKREGDARFLVPLRILGAPKPSAVEHYVRQDDLQKRPGATVTYGDLPGIDPAGADLNGRKFYRHQPNQVQDGPLTGNEGFLAEDDKIAKSNQATLARMVSRPGVRFGFTLRFRDLREWELGALFLALQPELIDRAPESLRSRDGLKAVFDAVARAHEAARSAAGVPLFALKLGYGRPLGLGSVRMTCKEALLLEDKDGPRLDATAVSGLQERCMKAFLHKTEGDHLFLADWLEAVRFAGCEKADYPRSLRENARPNEEPTTYTHHTEIRKAHAKARRRPEGTGRKEPQDGPVRLRGGS